ncbi:MAG: hypothetical protein H8E57_05465 [Candidatus Cloacimonetes bacterium]|nr:hypothetical protein [Candidatus Cloacimonadota bacterium]
MIIDKLIDKENLTCLGMRFDIPGKKVLYKDAEKQREEELNVMTEDG